MILFGGVVLGNNLEEEKAIDRSNYKRYKKQYISLNRKCIIACSISILSIIIMVIAGFTSIMYWWNHDNLSNMQFSKFVIHHYWWVIIIYILYIGSRIYHSNNANALSSYIMHLNKMEYEFNQKYGENI